MSEPQVITLNETNSIQIVLQYIEVAQKAGAFLLVEADILKRCKDVCFTKTKDPEINLGQAKQLLIQAINKGQSKGCYTLEDASMLYQVCQFVSSNLTSDPQTQPQPQPQIQEQESQESQESQEFKIPDDDLSSLSDPVPLRSSKPRIV